MDILELALYQVEPAGSVQLSSKKYSVLFVVCSLFSVVVGSLYVVLDVCCGRI